MCPKSRPSGARRARRAAGALLLLALIPPAAAADDRVRVIPRLSLSEEYTDNVLQSAHDATADYVTVLVPGFRLLSEGETGHARLDLSLPSYLYRDTKDLNGVDQRAQLDVDRMLSRRFAAFLNAEYFDLHDTDPIFQARTDPTSSALVFDEVYSGVQSQRWTSGSGGLRYTLTPRTLGVLTLGGFDRNVDDELDDGQPSTESSDYDGVFGSLGLRHNLTALDQLGLTLSVQDIRFQAGYGGGTLPVGNFQWVEFNGQTNTIVQAQSSWSRTWSPRWSTTFAVGLRSLVADGGNELVEVRFTDQGPQLVRSGGDGSNSIAFTGNAVLRRSFARGMMEFSFSQETLPSSNLGESQDVTTLSWNLRQELSSRWAFSLFARWSDSKSAIDSGPDSELEVRYLRARLDWRLRRRLTTFFAYEFLDQDASGGFLPFSESRFRVGFDFDYEIDVP